MNNSVLVIGIGNKYRSDDAVGLHIADSLLSENITDCEIKTTSGEGISLINLWENYEKVILVDAVNSGAEEGKIHRIDIVDEQLDSEWFRSSSHLFSIPEAVNLAKQVNKLPERIFFYGIEGENFNYGESLSDIVNTASIQLLPEIKDKIFLLQSL